MKTLSDRRISAALASALALLAVAAAQAQVHPERPTYPYEKCYGVAKAGANDCFTASNSCAGTSTQDSQKDAWIYLAKGTCLKISGGKLAPPKA